MEKNQRILGQYTYDGDGRRIRKTEWIESLQNYQTVIYVYSNFDVAYEKNLDTGQWATYVYDCHGKIAKKVDGLTDYYHSDHLGSTRLVTDEDGHVITEASYRPFGEYVVTGDETSYLYTGKEKDATGLYYYGARYYDPATGRFITRDTWPGDTQDPQSLNWYTYCRNNPLKYTDPWGNFFGVVLGASLLTKVAAVLAVAAPVLIIALAVIIVAIVVYEIYENNKKLEIGQVDMGETKNTPLEKFGVKSKVMINNDSCTARGVIVPTGDEKGTHYTFRKRNNQWEYHSPDDPNTWIPCTDEEAKYLDKLVWEAEKQYAKTHTCPGPIPPPPPLPPPPKVGGRKRQAY